MIEGPEPVAPVGRPKGATKPFKKADIDRLAKSHDLEGLRDMMVAGVMKMQCARIPKTKVEVQARELEVAGWFLMADMLGYEIDRRQASLQKIKEKMGKMSPPGEEIVIELPKPKPSFSEDI